VTLQLTAALRTAPASRAHLLEAPAAEPGR